MVDCISFSLLLGSNHSSCNSFFRLCSLTPFPFNETMVTLRFQPLYSVASSSTYDFFFQEANTLYFKHVLNIQGVISLGCHIRPACHQGFTRFIKTMPRMWIQLLCVRVLYSYGVTWILWPYMGIVTSHKSHGSNTRCWLVERKSAALWLVRT